MAGRNLTLIIVAACTGCSSSQLAVTRIKPGTPASFVGAPYALRMNRWDVTVTRTVLSCGPELKAKVEAEIKPAGSQPDPKQEFVIDTNSLAGPLKTSEVKLEYSNGAVVSFNATADDLTAQVVADVITTAVKLVSVAAAAGAAPGATPEACSDAVLTALATAKSQRPKVEAASKLVAARTDELKSSSAKATALGGAVDASTRRKLAAAYDALSAATEDLASKKDVLDKALAVLTHIQTRRWPDDGDAGSLDLDIPGDVLDRWGSLDTNPVTKASLAVRFELAPTTASGRDLTKGAEQQVDTRLGLPFRQPAEGRLRVCKGQTCDDTSQLAESVGPVLQLGRVYYLPCRSAPLTSITCTMTAGEDGQLKTLGTARRTAPAQVAAGIAKDASTQVAAIPDMLASIEQKRREARLAALKGAKDEADAVAALKSDPSADVKAQTQVLQASTALLQAEKAELDAQAALAAARTAAGQ